VGHVNNLTMGARPEEGPQSSGNIWCISADDPSSRPRIGRQLGIPVKVD